MRISRTTLSCLLRVKGYVAVRVGSAFRAAHSSRFLLHLFQPCPPVFPPGSAFAFTYILCLRSRSSIGAFIISPLPPCCQSRYRQQGRFPAPALPGFTGTTNPSATLSPVSRLPGAPGYTAYLAPPISRRGEEGFSSCLARPRYRAVATTPPECRSALASLRYAMLLSSRTWGLSLRVFCFSRPPVRSLSLRPGNSPATPYGGRVNGLQVIVFSPPCHPCYGALALTPAGLSPAERASLCWTHKSTNSLSPTLCSICIVTSSPSSPSRHESDNRTASSYNRPAAPDGTLPRSGGSSPRPSSIPVRSTQTKRPTHRSERLLSDPPPASSSMSLLSLIPAICA